VSAAPTAGRGRAGHDAPRTTSPRDWPRRVLVVLVRAWQLVVSPWYPPVCRFYPSCSAYAVRALDEHGALRGSWLTTRRLLRCHPWNPGGVDHVPRKEGGERSTAPPPSTTRSASPTI